jgi:hypothetical protein
LEIMSQEPSAGQADDHGVPVDVEYVGPFEHHDVVVNGWSVPYLEAQPMNGGKVTLTLDGRYGLDLDLIVAERVVPFLAHAIAVASGYASHPSADGELRDLRTPRPRRLLRLNMGEPEQSLGGSTS